MRLHLLLSNNTNVDYFFGRFCLQHSFWPIWATTKVDCLGQVEITLSLFLLKHRRTTSSEIKLEVSNLPIINLTLQMDQWTNVAVKTGSYVQKVGDIVLYRLRILN